MSVLETPRLYFTGQMVWDPIVTNNYQEFYNEVTCDPAPPNDPVADFRQRAIAAVDPRNWNPHGTHRSTFLAEVSGVDVGSGLDTSDPVVGAPASFLGMLVDAEPYGTISSQLFFDSMQFGIAGGCRLTCPRTFRVMSRYVNFGRNSYNQIKAGVASVIWQTSIPSSSLLQIDPHDSPALQALAEALASENGVIGLTVRWNTYRTIYYDDPAIISNSSPLLSQAAQALIAKLNVPNSFQPNPARSLLVGVVGLWRQGEPACEPGDRALLAQLPNETVATAFARVTGDALVLDLSNSISEVDAELTKQDLGTLSVCAMSADGAKVAKVLGSLPYKSYDRCSYVATSGLVTLPLSAPDAELAATAPLQLRSGSLVYLAEEVLRAAPSTQQNIYLNQTDAAVEAELQVLSFGAPAGAGVTVSRYDWDGTTATLLDTAQTGPDGVASFEVAPAAAGAVLPYLFTAGSEAPAPAQLDPQLTPYIYVRTLPADAEIGAMDPSWDNVYANVLAKWNAMAPCMDNWLLLDQPAQVRAYAAMLRKLTDPAAFEAYRFMPVTRDMTEGERTLLYKFLDAPPEPAAKSFAAQPTAAARPAGPDIERLNRAMRGG
ncbi:MAG TPA: hypothetical protein VEA61_07570 [Allosphingosinicella sp.]|nr:hypothetical protein [Allosphingosinicella sp.]